MSAPLHRSELRGLAGARAHPPGPERVAALRTAGEALAESLRARGGDVSVTPLSFGTIALEASAVLPSWRSRLRIVPLERKGWLLRAGKLRVLVDPATEGAFAATPFGERILQRHPYRLRALGLRPLGEVLGEAGVAPKDVDMVLLSHLRFVALEALLAELPRASVVVGERDVDPGHAGTPWERPFRDRAPVPKTDRIVPAPGDVVLAPGLALVSTPGLSAGSSTIVAAERGHLRVFSANGLCRDAWSPYESSLSGVREAVRLRDVEVVPRGDAASAILATESMILERTIADREGPWHAIDGWAQILPPTALLRGR